MRLVLPVCLRTCSGICFTGDGRRDKGLVDPLVGTSRRSYSVVVQSRLIVWSM